MKTIRTSVRFGEHTREVFLERRGDRMTARVDDREYRLSIQEPQRGIYSLVTDEGAGHSTEAVVHEAGGLFRVRVRGRFFEASVDAPGKSGTRGLSDHGPGIVKALMPGRVVRVLMKPGEKVQRGQGILVIEAMKMQNEIGSPREGVVKEIHVEVDDRVETGTLLALVE
jgi:biotin carboxyl carrier protein